MLGKTASELIEQFGTSAFEAVHKSDLDGLVYFNGNGTIEYINQAAMQIFGLDEEIVGRNVFELHDNQFDDLSVDLIVPSDHIDRARTTYETGEPQRSEMIVIEKEGDERCDIEVMWGPVERDGEIVGVVGSYRDVSSRPDIHDQLAFELSQIEKERRFFASLIDELDEGIFVFDEHLEIQLANSTALELLGLSHPIEGLTIEDCLAASSVAEPDRVIEQLRRTRDTGVSGDQLHRLESPRAHTQQLEIRARPVGLGESRYICTISNTTRRLEFDQMRLLGRIARLTTEAIELESLRKRIVELVADRLDVDFVVLTTYNGDIICPVEWRGLLIEDDMCLEPSSHPALQDAFESGTPRRTETWDWRGEATEGGGEQLILPLIGEEEPLGTLHLGYLDTSETSNSPAFDRDQETDVPDIAFLEALGNHVAATLRHAHLFERTHSDREWLEATLEQLPWGIFVYDRRGEILFVNPAAIQMTGYGAWSNLNTDSTPYQIIDPEDDQPLARADWPFFEAVRRETCCQRDVFFDFQTHQRDISLQATPIVDEAERPELFLGMLEDRTERRRHDRRKDEFLSIASHELRSPLTPLTGVLQLARRQRERGDDVDLSLLVRAERQVDQLTRLIDGLLDLTRIETDRIELERERIELGTCIERAAQPWEYSPEDVELEVSKPDEPLEISIDPDRIQQVITNLIDNAVQYSKTNHAVRIDVTAQSERAIIEIEDNGVGMDEDTVARVFDRFFHGRNDDCGPRSMGLGLYICRQIVEQHDGSISIDSTKGEGTRIEITLPRR